MIVLYSGVQEQRMEYFKVAATLLGINIDGEKKKKGDEFLFKDPSEYENMSEEEKKELTVKMQNKYKRWAEGKSTGKGLGT